jgi:hypothetical protein
MSLLINTKLDFGNARRITNLAAAAATGEPVTFEQLNSALEGIAWKDNVRVSPSVNVTIASPGATLDSINMVSGDRVLLRAQTTQTENGIYVWNGSAVPMTRALDATTFEELESAVVTIDEGTAAGASYRQTQVNGVIGTNNIVWSAFGGATGAATETASGIAEIATQAETDAGADDLRFITSLKLANYSGRAKRYSQTIGDGSATSIAITHNLGTEDVIVQIRETGGSKREVLVEVQHTSTTVVTLIFDIAPALNAYRVTILA